MPVMRGPEGGECWLFLTALVDYLLLLKIASLMAETNFTLGPISKTKNTTPDAYSLVVAGKWRIGEDLLPRRMTVTHTPNGTEFYPAYCAGHTLDFPGPLETSIHQVHST